MEKSKSLKTTFSDEPQIVETDKIRKIKDEQGHSKINNYTIISTLGEGSFGKVKLAIKDETEKKYAIKKFRKSVLKRKREMYRDASGKMKFKDALEDVLREIAIMKKINHPNIIRLYEVIENPENDHLYMVIDYAEGGQLLDWDDDQNIFINKVKEGYFTDKELRSSFRQMILGLDYVHQHGIVHRDLKPQNILRGSGDTVQICDFGVSSVFGDESDLLTGSKGTYHFMPPETLEIKGGSPYHGKAADIWSLGVTFYAFVYLQVPFFGEDEETLFDAIRENPISFPDDVEVKDGLKDLISKMLDKNPETRIKMEDIKLHPWINEGEECLTKLINQELVTVTHEEIHGAFTRLETLMIAQKFIKKLKSKKSDFLDQANNNLKNCENKENPVDKDNIKIETQEIIKTQQELAAFTIEDKQPRLEQQMQRKFQG